VSDVLTDILAKRRDRAIATILNTKEQEVDPYLTDSPRGREAAAKLRKAVLDQLNDFHEMCLDVLRALETGDTVVLNDHYLQLLAEVHDAIVVRNGNGHH
jgi:hypothetical protein